MPFVITGELNGERVYWRKWSGASQAGRPRWVTRLTLKCLYEQSGPANATANGTGSTHWRTTVDGQPVQNVQVEEVNSL